MSHTCVGRAWSPGAFRSHQCGKTAAYEHDGQWYCKTHHPPTIAAKANAREEERDRKWRYEKSLRDKADAERAEMKRRAALFPELLEALERIGGFTVSQFMGPNDMALECVNVARAATAKAEEK
jgi:hypothetical protein